MPTHLGAALPALTARSGKLWVAGVYRGGVETL
jgi:hypothetical protein